MGPQTGKREANHPARQNCQRQKRINQDTTEEHVTEPHPCQRWSPQHSSSLPSRHGKSGADVGDVADGGERRPHCREFPSLLPRHRQLSPTPSCNGHPQ